MLAPGRPASRRTRLSSSAPRTLLGAFALVAGFAALAHARAFQAPAPNAPAPAGAQAKTAFDPVRDLEGFEARRASPFRELYPLETFATKLGIPLDAAGLAALKEQWKTECAAVDAQVATLSNDPKAAERYVLERRLEKHPYFSKIAYEVRVCEPAAGAAATPAWLLVLQKPAKEDPTFATKIVDVVTPVLTKLTQVVDERLAKPFALARRADKPLCIVAVLATPGDFENYQRATRDGDDVLGNVAFDAHLGAVVGRHDPFSAKWSLLQGGEFVRQLAMELVELHCDLPAGRRLPKFQRVGMASLLTTTPQGKLDELGKPWLPPTMLRDLVDAAQSEALRPVLLPLKTLSSLRSAPQLAQVVDARAKLLGVETPEWKWIDVGARVQGHMWAYFMQESGDAALRDAWLRAYARSCHGIDLLDALKEALGGDAAVAGLDARFWTWVFKRADGALAGVSVDTSNAERVVESFSANPPKATKPAAEASSTPGSAAKGPAPKPEPPFDPSSLAPRADEHDARIGAALLLARAGDLDGARAALDALAKTELPAEPRARVASSLECVDGAIRLRAAWLESLRAKGAKLPIVRDGKKVLFTIARIEGGKIVFAEAKNGISELPLSAIDPVELAKEADQKEERGDAPAVARPFLYALAGDARYEKLAKDDDPSSKALRTDATTWMPIALRSARAAEALDALAKAGKPADAEQGAAALARVEALMREFADDGLVAARRDGLRRLAKDVLTAQSARLAPQEFLAAKSEALGDGRVRLTWTFDDPRELADTAPVVDYEKAAAEWMKKNARGKAPAAEGDAAAPAEPEVPLPAPTFAIEKGDLVMSGGLSRRVGLPFKAPFTVKVRVRWEDRIDELTPTGSFAISVCDDLDNGLIKLGGSGTVFVWDSQRGATKTIDASGDWTFNYGAADEWTLTHDGKEIHWARNGDERGKAPVGGLKSGWLVLTIHSLKTMCVETLVVEGTLETKGLDDARRAWVERKLTALSLSSAPAPK